MNTLRGSIADRIYTLSTRMPDHPESGGEVSAAVEDQGNRLRNSGCVHLLILVHGFNNSTSAARDSYRLQISRLSRLFSESRLAPDAVAFFYWPGDVGGWISVGGYPWDIPRARDSAARLADYLKSFPNAANPGALKISMIGHSLGCRLILEALARQLPTALALNIGVVNLLAAAVPVALVDAAASLQISVRSPRTVLKCYSLQDLVLRDAFPIGQRVAYELGKETQNYGEAVGLYGHPSAMGTAIQTTNGHSDYWDDASVANRFSATIDPTLLALPAARTTGTRKLAGAASHSARPLPTR